MWPWSLIRGLRSDNARLGVSLVDAENKQSNLRGQLEHSLSRIETLEAIQRERDNHLERLRHDYEVMRADYTAVVSILGNHAQRPRGHTLFEDDPFKEDNSKPDDFVSPPEGEPVDGEAVMTALETQGGQGTE